MKYTKFIPLLALCLVLAACGPKETVPDASSSVPDASQTGPDASEPDTSSQEEPLPFFTEEEKAGAIDAIYDYYRDTVFEVETLLEIDTWEGGITFQVICSKDGVRQNPHRAISLERRNGIWTVINEGY